MLSEDEANQAWSEAYDHDISETSWGFYSYGDASPAIGGGVGCFLWFSSSDLMLDFIESVLPVSPPGPAASDHNKTAKEVTRIVSAARDQAALPDETREQLNHTLRRYSQIEWWGTFQTLLSDDELFASKVRQSFREEAVQTIDQCEPGQSTNDNEIDNFKTYLKSYGL
jgi:hypothetical protein